MSIAFAPEATQVLAEHRAFENHAAAADLAAKEAQHQPVPTAPFGWYPDPAGSPKLRWWNGSSWTDRLEAPRPALQIATGYSIRDLNGR
ncbi:MAG: hypothetical protein QOK46_792 [Microbacteriaceae bacterium]|jgi:hypothetical protein|nr:hypothetical protein [Microbacteriaceae bacterium]MDQ1553714.1 hypothetical protein [Microbacteriaceae bacterium]MDQ1605820.1 hypothetical protein [Microbacteriaceae bacterium]